MISLKHIKKSQAKHIIKLIEQMTRAEVLARLGKFDNLEFIDYALHKIEIEKKLLKYIFGTSSLLKLGHRWKLLKKRRKHGRT